MRRPIVVAAVAAAAWLGMPAAAHADPAGPTDYRTTIVSITPATDVIDVAVEGGDAFLRIEVEPGHDVLILGYDQEPYLRIDADGVVEQNRRSYATYYNEERYGTSDVPDIVDNDAAPDWERVGDGGAWAWHDHRAHWMLPDPPIGLEPGDSLPIQTVPVVVDGVPVEIAVRITLQQDPALAPVVFGAVIGLGVALLGVLLGPATTGLVMLVLSAAALLIGIGQFVSLPAETDPLFTWWLLPAVALASVVGAIVTYGRSRFALLGLTAVAAAQLLVWAVERRHGLTRAVLPTDLPAGLDRFVSVAALTGALVVLIATGVRLFARPTPS
ncbi:MAG: hypothetical protein ACLGHQ_13975 [Acidimicrobiia bacterium]